MNNKRKVAFLMLLMGVILIALVGCGMSTSKRERKIKELLRDKYGEEFEVREIYVTGGVDAWCYPVNDSSLIFKVSTSEKVDSIIADDYLQSVVERKLSNELQKCINQDSDVSFVLANLPLGSTSGYKKVDAKEVDLQMLREYIKTENLMDCIFVMLFCDRESQDANEYNFICEIEKMYSSDELPDVIVEAFYGDDQFIIEMKKAYEQYGMTDIGSVDKTDVWDVMDKRRSILIYFRNNNEPYIRYNDSEEKKLFDYNSYKEMKMEVIE